MKQLSILIVSGALFCLSTVYGQNSSVTWGAAESNGIGTASGTPLPNGSGDLMLVGSFNISNATIAANGSNEAFLLSHFIQFGSSAIGAGTPNGAGSASDGYWLQTTQNSTNGLAIQNTEVYYWLFNAPTTGGATQYGIFTAPSNPGWVFPTDNTVNNITVTDLSDVPHDSSGILWGSFGTGTSRDLVSPLYDLAAIPEPSTLGLVGVGAFIAVAVRRFRKS